MSNNNEWTQWLFPSVRKDSFKETSKPETWLLWGRGDERSFTSHYWIYHLLIFATILLILGVMGISSYSYCTCKEVQLKCIKCCNMLALSQVAVQTPTQILYPCCSFQKTDISKDEAKCVYRYISEFIQAERYFSSFEMSDCCSKKNEYKR